MRKLQRSGRARTFVSIGLLVVAAVLRPPAVSAELEAPLATASNPMTIVLDERTAPRGFALAHMTIPVRPGPFTLVYPEWIPGEHGPTGPLNDLSELRISASGQAIPWQRDQVDMYAFHLNVPAGVSVVTVDFTVLLNHPNNFVDGNLATQYVMVGNWNRYLLYQPNIDNTRYFVRASLILPPSWDYASALPVASRAGNRVTFRMVTLERLVDSPTDSGRFYRHLLMWSDGTARTYLDAFADHPEDLNFSKALVDEYRCVTPEAIALYGGRHWNVYHSELTLSDLIPAQGIEHHESSDDRAGDTFMTDNANQMTDGDLLTHEFSHSWNGKYRRPFDLQQPNFNEPYPEHTELLWQYEGMNQYMGDLLAFRCHIKGKPSDYPEYFASIYADMASESGRKTTPIIDLTTGAPYFYIARGDYGSIRRSAFDFYTEGELMWLDADTIIRRVSGGKKSIDDYAKVFAGGTSVPRVVTYTRGEIERDLSAVVPYDWHGFFGRYVYAVAPEPPSDEIARAGYRYVLTDTPNKYLATTEKVEKFISSTLDVGVRMDTEGNVTDVREGSAAWNAGIGKGMKIVAVNAREFTADAWHAAIKATSASASPLVLLVDHAGYYRDIAVNYHGGLRYPHLVRLAGTVDMLADIVRPHATGGQR